MEDRRRVEAIADEISSWAEKVEQGKREIVEMVLRDVFDEDAHAMARADRLMNPRFAFLLERIQTDRKFKRRAFTSLLRLVAYDHLVPGRYWPRIVDLGIKESLLPLVVPDSPTGKESLKLLNAGAKQVIEFDLDPERTTDYVREVLRGEGRNRRRNAGFTTYDRQVDRNADLFASDDGVNRLLAVCDRLSRDEVTELEKKLERNAAAMLAAAKKLRGRGKPG